MKYFIIIMLTTIFLNGCNVDEFTKDKNNEILFQSPDGHIKIQICYNTQEEKEKALEIYESSFDHIQYELECDYWLQFVDDCDEIIYR